MPRSRQEPKARALARERRRRLAVQTDGRLRQPGRPPLGRLPRRGPPGDPRGARGGRLGSVQDRDAVVVDNVSLCMIQLLY